MQNLCWITFHLMAFLSHVFLLNSAYSDTIYDYVLVPGRVLAIVVFASSLNVTLKCQCMLSTGQCPLPLDWTIQYLLPGCYYNTGIALSPPLFSDGLLSHLYTSKTFPLHPTYVFHLIMLPCLYLPTLFSRFFSIITDVRKFCLQFIYSYICRGISHFRLFSF